MINKSAFAFLFLIASLGGCSSKKASQPSRQPHKASNVKTYSAGSKPVYTITFKKTVSYGTTKDKIVLVGGPRNQMARVDDKGRVFILAYKQNAIDVFTPGGRYLTAMGGKGKGPGEFISMYSLKLTPRYMYVWDSELYRISVFSLDSLSYSHTINLNNAPWSHIKNLQNMWFQNLIFAGNDGKLLVRFVPIAPDLLRKPKLRKKYEKKDRYHYYWMSPDGKIIPHEVLEQQAQKWVYATIHSGPLKGPHASYLFFNPKPLITVSNDGTIFAANSEHFLVNVCDAQGTHLRTIHYAYKNAPLKRKALIKRYDKVKFPNLPLKVIKHRKLPKTWPALHLMLIDDHNRLWISTIVKNKKVYQWWILNKKGKFLARFIWPRDKPIQDIKNNYFYATVRNKEGVARIVRYKIQMHHSENAANP
jgi:hypothetical protein